MSEVVVHQQRVSRLAFRPRRAWLLVIPLVFFVTFFIFPIIKMATLSFQVQAGGETSWSLANYQKLFGDTFYLRLLPNTFGLSLAVTFVCAVAGYPVAYALARGPKALRGILFLTVISPLLISLVARAFGWLVILSSDGLINNLLTGAGVLNQPARLLFTTPAVIAGLVHISLPYMILSVSTVLADLDERLEEAAWNLGAGPFRTFWYVTLPLSLRGIVTGSIIVFGLSVGAYAMPALLGGGKVRVAAIEIYDRVFVLSDWSFASTLAIVLLAATTMITIILSGLALRKTA